MVFLYLCMYEHCPHLILASIHDLGDGGAIGLSVSGPSSPRVWQNQSSVPLSSNTLVLGLVRSSSIGFGLAGQLESRRQAITEMVSQIRKYDPYPCILGIPVMPALFATSKLYIFICFSLIGFRVLLASLRQFV